MSGCYAFPAVKTDITGVMTNKFATDAIRGAVYFGNAGITRDLLVLGGYALAGLVISYVVLMLAGRRPGGLPVRVADRPRPGRLSRGST